MEVDRGGDAGLEVPTVEGTLPDDPDDPAETCDHGGTGKFVNGEREPVVPLLLDEWSSREEMEGWCCGGGWWWSR